MIQNAHSSRFISSLSGLAGRARLAGAAAILAWLCLLMPLPALAIDPGRVRGSLQVNGQAITLTQAYAHLHDNAEGLLDRPRELRLLLSDREVPQAALAGLPPLPVANLARDGQVQGLLLKLDPHDPRRLELALLFSSPQLPSRLLILSSKSYIRTYPASPRQKKGRGRGARTSVAGPDSGASTATLELHLSSQRLGGTFECPAESFPVSADRPDLACSLQFSAPVFQELPVTDVLTGRAALASPQVQILRAQIRALAQGDWAAVQRLATARRYQNLQNRAAPDPDSWAKQEAARLQAAMPHLQRLVVRGQGATVVFADHHWQTFVRTGEAWQMDD
jgi:hypothetical protein